MCALPSVHCFKLRLIQDEEKLSEHRFETLLRERFTFLEQQHGNPRKQEGKELAHGASARNRSKRKARGETFNSMKSADDVSPSTPA